MRDVSVISKNPAEFPCEISSNDALLNHERAAVCRTVIVRSSQLAPHPLKTTHWWATWPSWLIVALPHEPVSVTPPISTNVAWKGCVVEATAGLAKSTTESIAASKLIIFIC